MKVYILKEKDINKRVADRFIRLINKKENPVIGLATGSTPEGVYNELIKAFKNGIVSFKNTISFNLDEACSYFGFFSFIATEEKSASFFDKFSVIIKYFTSFNYLLIIYLYDFYLKL